MATIEELENRIIKLEKQIEELMHENGNNGWKEWGETNLVYLNDWWTMNRFTGKTVLIQYRVESGKLLYRGILDGQPYAIIKEMLEGKANSGTYPFSFTHVMKADHHYRFKLPLTEEQL